MMSSWSRITCSCVQEGRDWKMMRQCEIIGAALLAALASTCALADDVVINLNGGQQTGSFDGRGPITCSYTVHGPGTFFSTGRVYPNSRPCEGERGEVRGEGHVRRRGVRSGSHRKAASREWRACGRVPSARNDDLPAVDCMHPQFNGDPKTMLCCGIDRRGECVYNT